MSKILYNEENGTIAIAIPAELVPEFKQLVARAMNTWERASPEMKKFRDDVSGMSKLLNKVSAKRCPKCLHLPCECTVAYNL